MTTKREKADYVKKQTQFRNHHCHWPGCKEQVPPAMWGCRAHWFRLPLYLRNKIWAAYRPGQEKDLRPSRTYLKVAQEAEDWIRANHNDKVSFTKKSARKKSNPKE